MGKNNLAITNKQPFFRIIKKIVVPLHTNFK